MLDADIQTVTAFAVTVNGKLSEIRDAVYNVGDAENLDEILDTCMQLEKASQRLNAISRILDEQRSHDISTELSEFLAE